MTRNIGPLAIAFLMLAGCTGQTVALTNAATIYLTKPSEPPPADTASQIPPHEVWCYQTMGTPDCYAEAQNVPSERLIHVEPQNRYPLSPNAYKEEVVRRRLQQASADPAPLDSALIESRPMPEGAALP